MSKYLIAFILLGHGFIISAQSFGTFSSDPAQITNPAWLDWWPTTLGRSWLLVALNLEGSLLEKIFGLLWLVSGICFIGAALSVVGLLVPHSYGRLLTLFGSSSSLLMLLFYLHPFFLIGILINVAVFSTMFWDKLTLFR